jgi:hypothetical protein
MDVGAVDMSWYVSACQADFIASEVQGQHLQSGYFHHVSI